MLLFVFLCLLSCSTQTVIKNSLLVNKWKLSDSNTLQVEYENVSLNSNNYNYYFFENGKVNLFHTNKTILEKNKHSEITCLTGFLEMINSLPKIKLVGKWKITENKILKIEYSYKGKVFTRKMKIDFLSKAYLNVELLHPKFEFN